MHVEILPFNSRNQIQSIGLRYNVLRNPLGLFFNAEDLASEDEETHVAAIEGSEVIGIMLLKNVGDGVLKMRQVAVSEAWQGKNVGGKMVQFSEEFAKQNNFNKIELHARETAVNFYLKHNYKVVGEKFMEVGIPHWKMEKELGKL